MLEDFLWSSGLKKKIHLPVQGMWVQSLAWEDATYCRATEAFVPQLLKPSHPRAQTPQQAPQLEKTHAQQWRPRTAKNKHIFKKC